DARGGVWPPRSHPGAGRLSLHRPLRKSRGRQHRFPPRRQDHLPIPRRAGEGRSMSIRVLIVDDSALIREVLSRTLGHDGDITVVGTAEDPIDARAKIKSLNPDVVTLDIEMPNMNGLAFLDK